MLLNHFHGFRNTRINGNRSAIVSEKACSDYSEQNLEVEVLSIIRNILAALCFCAANILKQYPFVATSTEFTAISDVVDRYVSVTSRGFSEFLDMATLLL